MRHNILEYANSYICRISNILNEISHKEVGDFCEVLFEARNSASTIFFIGNGGSSSTASHFANDLSIGVKGNDKPFKAVSLCDNLSIVTAIGNDFGYDEVFSRQLEVYAQKGDVLVSISASGNSKNILEAVDTARLKGLKTVGLTSFDGGKLRQMVDVSVHVPTRIGEYGPAEDGHLILDHLVSSYFNSILQDNK